MVLLIVSLFLKLNLLEKNYHLLITRKIPFTFTTGYSAYHGPSLTINFKIYNGKNNGGNEGGIQAKIKTILNLKLITKMKMKIKQKFKII